MKKLNEAIQHNDLRGLLSNVISIDQYNSKVDDDKNAVVVAFEASHKDVAADLSQFIETGHSSAIDVDISPGASPDGTYYVFVEFHRDSFLYRYINVMLEDIKNIDDTIEEWQFVSYENNDAPINWNEENFNDNVITSSYEYVLAHDENAKAISERINFLKNY